MSSGKKNGYFSAHTPFPSQVLPVSAISNLKLSQKCMWVPHQSCTYQAFQATLLYPCIILCRITCQLRVQPNSRVNTSMTQETLCSKWSSRHLSTLSHILVVVEMVVCMYVYVCVYLSLCVCLSMCDHILRKANSNWIINIKLIWHAVFCSAHLEIKISAHGASSL